MWRIVYTILFTLLLPLVLARLWWRGRANPAYRSRIGERLGNYALEHVKKRLWVHAVSVGEVNAALPLIRQIQSQWPEYRILVTTMTPTGADQVVRSLGDSVDHRYVPYDQPWFVARALKTVAPQALIIIETEIWPNLIHVAASKHVPVLYMNMRLSEKSFGGYLKIRPLIAPQLRKVIVIGAQSDKDAQRAAALGARTEIIQVVGNIKYDASLPDGVRRRGDQLREQLGNSRLVWIAASTHAGEDEKILVAHHKVIDAHPQALLILVPRHPERFQQVYELAAREFNTVRRSQPDTDLADCQVYLGDTMGEMLDFFAASDISFVAGSLVSVGGHNVLEPWLLEKPVIVGPHMFNFLQIAEQALEHDAMIQIKSADELGKTVIELSTSPARRQQLTVNANQLLEQNRGALQHSIQILSAYL